MHARQALCMRRPLLTGVTIRDLPAASCVGAAPVDDRGCASCWPGVTPGVLWRGPRSCTRGPSASRTGVVALAGGGSGVSGRPGHQAGLATRPEGRSQVTIRYDPPPRAAHGTRGDRTPCMVCVCHACHGRCTRAMPHACGPRRAGDRHSPGTRARSGRRHAPPRTDRGLRARLPRPGTSGRDPHTVLDQS